MEGQSCVSGSPMHPRSQEVKKMCFDKMYKSIPQELSEVEKKDEKMMLQKEISIVE